MDINLKKASTNLLLSEKCVLFPIYMKERRREIPFLNLYVFLTFGLQEIGAPEDMGIA